MGLLKESEDFFAKGNVYFILGMERIERTQENLHLVLSICDGLEQVDGFSLGGGNFFVGCGVSEGVFNHTVISFTSIAYHTSGRLSIG